MNNAATVLIVLLTTSARVSVASVSGQDTPNRETSANHETTKVGWRRAASGSG